MDVLERRLWRGSDFAAGKKVPSKCRCACVLKQGALIRGDDPQTSAVLANKVAGAQLRSGHVKCGKVDIHHHRPPVFVFTG
ncbi:MAG TPA: hypothetical protein VLA28_11440, partial [Afifellaceae bacterium]|nr:hypothetical protein [Afifellaceae bacterium]